MKTNFKKVFYKISILLFCLYGHAGHAGTPVPGEEPPGDPAPIDGNITILILIAVFFGIYIIYNYKLNKKRPI